MHKHLLTALSGATLALSAVALAFDADKAFDAGKESGQIVPEAAQSVASNSSLMRQVGQKQSLRMRAPEGGYSAPVTFVPTQEQAGECTIIDNNGDGKKWALGNYNGRDWFKYSYSFSLPGDDWCVLPALNLEAGVYKVSYTYFVHSASNPENFRISFGQGTDPTAWTETLAEHTGCTVTEPVTETQLVTVAAAGSDYHVGLYAFSDANKFYLYIGDVKIEKVDNSRPMAPELTVTANALECDLTVKLPTRTVGGEAIEAGTTITANVTVDGTPLVGGELTGAPGQELTAHYTSPTNGEHTFAASVSYTVGGETKTSEEVSKSLRLIKSMPSPLPMGHVIAPDEDEFAACTVVNGNSDNSTWEYSATSLPDNGAYPGCFRYSYNYVNAADEWLLLPAWDGSQAGAHAVTFDMSTSYETEGLEVCWAYKDEVEALDPEAEDYKTQLASLFAGNVIYSNPSINTQKIWTPTEVLFSLPEASDFIVAFHEISPASHSYFYLQNISVSARDNSTPQAPVWGEVAFDGGEGTISLTLPQKNLGGNDIESTVYADIKLDGEAYGEPLSGEPGQEKTLSFTGLSIGKHTVAATTYIMKNGEKCGSLSASKDFTVTVPSSFAYELPLSLDVNSSTADYFVTLNVNGDDKVWEPQEDSFKLPYNGSEASDDWIFTSAINIADATKFYDLAVSARSQSTSYAESIEVWIGTGQNVESMTQKVIDESALQTDQYTDLSAQLRVPSAGRYYVGIHGCSPKNMFGLYVNHISLKESEVKEEAPAAVTDLTGDGFEDGSDKANLSFKFPENNMVGAALDAATEHTATVNTPVETVTATGFPGSEASLEINCNTGNNDVMVYVGNEVGNGPIAMTTVRCGLDAPKPVIITGRQYSDDNMSVTITWNPVTEGTTGNHIHADNMSYLIFEYDYDDEDWYQLDAFDATDPCSYTYTLAEGAPQQMVNLGIQAYNGLNSGSSMSAISAVVGTPLALPIDEDFANGKLHYVPLTISSTLPADFWPDWKIGDPSGENSQIVSPNGWSLIGHTSFNRGDSSIGLPKFSTEGMTDAALRLCTYDYPYTAEMKITATATGVSEPVEIGTIGISQTTEGWNEHIFRLPEELMGRKWVDVQISMEFVGGSSTSPYIDAYKVGAYDEVALGKLTAMASAVKGLTGAIEFTGLSGEKVAVYRTDGTLVGKYVITSESQSVPAAPGIYVVKAGKHAVKAAVR